MAKRNQIYNDAVWEKVNKENKSILSDYILEMKSNNRSEKTIYQYAADIKMFFCWSYAEEDNKSILKMKKRSFRRFFLELQESGTSPSRINRVQCSLRNMLEFCVNDDDEYEDYEINVMKSVKGLSKEEVRDIVFLTDEQVTLILDKLIEKKQYQKALYCSLSYDSAGRRAEVFQVMKDGFLDSGKTNEVRGKGAKRFSLIKLSRTNEIARMYFEQRGEDDIPELWIVGKDEDRRAAKYETLYNWAKSFRSILFKEYGEVILLNSHSFRHSALENYSNGSHYNLSELGKDKLDLKTLKALANHNDISTTEGYLKDRDEELLNETFNL